MRGGRGRGTKDASRTTDDKVEEEPPAKGHRPRLPTSVLDRLFMPVPYFMAAVFNAIVNLKVPS